MVSAIETEPPPRTPRLRANPLPFLYPRGREWEDWLGIYYPTVTPASCRGPPGGKLRNWRPNPKNLRHGGSRHKAGMTKEVGGSP
jgi:hypothetical protein